MDEMRNLEHQILAVIDENERLLKIIAQLVREMAEPQRMED